ncbi:hypothetical protein Glove_8g77 [Diversispora epigaea]|uniref:Uncharacterized protein n=1 Tax=Diversispora epigaea TaxID=1348612 RepID=A0A397JXW1_9GLOM|nr:hypothetical protein Glove_8g77 [Diversispora epigaea]
MQNAELIKTCNTLNNKIDNLEKIIVEFIENKKDEISSEFVTKLVKEIADETFNKVIYPTQDDFKKISESVAKKNYREIFNTYSLKKWNTFYVGRIMANLLKKHRQLRETAASTYRKALFSIFGEKELPYIQSTNDHNVIATWKASPQVRKIYGNLFERIPNSETTYIDRVLEKTCNADTSIHQKAFAIVTCENFLNPKLPNIINSSEELSLEVMMIDSLENENLLNNENSNEDEGEGENEDEDNNSYNAEVEEDSLTSDISHSSVSFFENMELSNSEPENYSFNNYASDYNNICEEAEPIEFPNNAYADLMALVTNYNLSNEATNADAN